MKRNQNEIMRFHFLFCFILYNFYNNYSFEFLFKKYSFYFILKRNNTIYIKLRSFINKNIIKN